jgi:rhodanese-related sulfurtransferase
MVKKVHMSSVLKRMGNEETVLIDILDAEIYEKIHLMGAINIPMERLEDEVREKVDPDTPVILYGIDYECPVSKRAGEILEEMGYTDVSYYPGGRKEWFEEGMPVEEKS